MCGLKWSYDDRELASGGNDNQVMVIAWPLYQFQCPIAWLWSTNCLIDFQLLVWNQHSQQPILKLTEHTAAVKAIAWSPHQNGLLASGGGTADRCIRFWNTTNGHQLNHVDTGSQVSASSLLSHFHFMFFNRLSSPGDPICLPKFQCFFNFRCVI